MNLHEYQGKELLSSFGVRIQRGIVADNVNDAILAAEKLNLIPKLNGGLLKHRFMLE